MLNRLINGGTTEIDGISLIGLLTRTTGDPRVPLSVRESARKFLTYQQQRELASKHDVSDSD